MLGDAIGGKAMKQLIATTDGSGVASVRLMLPSTAQTVTVTAEGPSASVIPSSPSPKLHSESCGPNGWN